MNPSPTNEPHLSIVPCYVADADTAVTILRDIAGMEVHVDVPHGTSRWREVCSTDQGVRLLLVELGETRYRVYANEFGRAALLWFRADDLARVVGRARDIGVRVPVPPEPAPWRRTWQWTQLTDRAGTRYGFYTEA